MKEEPEFSSRIVYQMAVQGDGAAQQIFRVVGAALGSTIADLVNIFNLPMYVIGGGVANAWTAFSPAMFRELEKQSVVFRAGENMQTHHNRTAVTHALLGSEAGLMGAARLPMILRDSHNYCSRTIVAQLG